MTKEPALAPLANRIVNHTQYRSYKNPDHLWMVINERNRNKFKSHIPIDMLVRMVEKRLIERDGAAYSESIKEPLEPLKMNSYSVEIILRAEVARLESQVKFPQPNYVTLKVAEEAGELVRASVHYAEGRLKWQEVEDEAVQAIAMIMRLLIEGDQVNGVSPPSHI